MSVDMSLAAVTARLKRVSQLRRLCLALAKAKPIPPVPAPQQPVIAADPTRNRSDR